MTDFPKSVPADLRLRVESWTESGDREFPHAIVLKTGWRFNNFCEHADKFNSVKNAVLNLHGSVECDCPECTRKQEATTERERLEPAMTFVDKIAPEHSRTSCSDESLINQTYAPDDFGGCRRCDLLYVVRKQRETDARLIREVYDGVLPFTEITAT